MKPLSVALSVALIVKNEADKISNILADCTGAVDEIVVVDTGSTDNTVKISQKFTDSVYRYEWKQDFAAARNFAFSKCNSDWIMWVDADDRITPDVQMYLKQFKDRLVKNSTYDSVDAIFAEYRLYSPVTKELQIRVNRERIIRRSAKLRWSGRVHESVEIPKGRLTYDKYIWVEHRPPIKAPNTRNLDILTLMVNDGDDSPRTLYFLATELMAQKAYQSAEDMFTRYLQKTDLLWEKYQALIARYKCRVLSLKQPLLVDSLYAAIQLEPARAEAYILLGLYFLDNQYDRQAIPFFLAASGCTPSRWDFCEEADYTYRPWQYVSTCFFNLKMWDKAKSAIKLAILMGSPDKKQLYTTLEELKYKS